MFKCLNKHFWAWNIWKSWPHDLPVTCVCHDCSHHVGCRQSGVRGDGDPAGSHLLRLHHHEPRLRWTIWTPRQPQGEDIDWFGFGIIDLENIFYQPKLSSFLKILLSCLKLVRNHKNLNCGWNLNLKLVSERLNGIENFSRRQNSMLKMTNIS